MQPKELKSPFSWKERRVLLSQGVLFVPSYYSSYEEFQFPGWADPALFGNDKPVRIEFCSGNGDWIAYRASIHPESNWVAVEKRFDRTRKIWAKVKNKGLENLFIICGEAITSTHHYIPSLSVEEVFVNFPDPWPKHRHAKHRLINEIFIEEVRRILKPGGSITLVTDDIDYTEQMAEEFTKCQGFTPFYPAPFFVTDLQDYGTSYFEELWRGKGLKIHYLKFIKS